MNKLLKIIFSRTRPKDTSKDWVQNRLKVCKECPFNTDNIDKKSFSDKFKIKANKILNFILNKKVTEQATCSICGCMIIYKSAEEDEKCPKGKWKK